MVNYTSTAILEKDTLEAFYKFGRIIQNFVDKYNSRVFKQLAYTNDKEIFVKIINRLFRFACSRELLKLTNGDLDLIIEYINRDFYKAKIKLLITSYSLYIDRKWGQYL